jgi:hypothetical protein
MTTPMTNESSLSRSMTLAAAYPSYRVLSPEQPERAPLDRQINLQIDTERNAQPTPPRQVALYRFYDLGVQTYKLTQGQRDVLEGLLVHEFCDNVCHEIIAMDSDRLRFLAWECPDENVQAFLDTLYTKNTVDALSGESHFAVCRDGNYAISVRWDNKQARVVLGQEPWWDGIAGMFVAYDMLGEMTYAVREWPDFDGSRRRVIFFPDHIERWRSQSGAAGSWEPYDLPGNPGSALQPWLKDDGTPLHIPVVHFKNAGRGPSLYGRSELAGGALGFQDQLNDLQYDMSAAGRFTGFQMYWMTGVPVRRDSKGNPVAPKVAPGAFHHSENSDAKYGVLSAGDVSHLIALYELKLKCVARMTRTPYFLITGGDWPSGEALWQAKQPFNEKLKQQVMTLCASWASVGHKASEVQNAFGRGGLNEDADTAPISARFEDPDKRDPLSTELANKAFWDAAQSAVMAGIPIELYLKNMGWAAAQIEELNEAQLTAIRLSASETEPAAGEPA